MKPASENGHIRMVLDTIPPPPYPWHSSGGYYSQERRIRGFLGKTARSGSSVFALHPSEERNNVTFWSCAVYMGHCSFITF